MVTTCMILCIVPGSAACVCDLRFSTGRCFDGEGNCECLENYRGSQCNQCNEGYYGFPNCKRKLTGDPCFEENYNYIYSKCQQHPKAIFLFKEQKTTCRTGNTTK